MSGDVVIRTRSTAKIIFAQKNQLEPITVDGTKLHRQGPYAVFYDVDRALIRDKSAGELYVILTSKSVNRSI